MTVPFWFFFISKRRASDSERLIWWLVYSGLLDALMEGTVSAVASVVHSRLLGSFPARTVRLCADSEKCMEARLIVAFPMEGAQYPR
jgi:hypothetical protein